MKGYMFEYDDEQSEASDDSYDFIKDINTLSDLSDDLSYFSTKKIS